ncbi:MAG TPA: YqgE/AlgH family protein [Tepidiformaceae bacterium]|nr:YqgE/AlgH family protein [Tepidiformaceae bacterium]
MPNLTGKLLVATPVLTDPNFARAVVLVCSHDPSGAFGLILNRPLEGALLSEHLPGWASHASSPAVVFLGGPVEPSVAFALASIDGGQGGEGFTPIFRGVSQLDLGLAKPEAHPPGVPIRVFVGYAGWGAGQLDGEVEAEAWFVVEPRADDAFTETPADLWHAILRRQGGRLAMFAYAPTDPRAN